MDLADPFAPDVVEPLAVYQKPVVGSLWPPQVPADARYMPIEPLYSTLQLAQVRRCIEIKIVQQAYNKMMFYVERAPGEVSGFGKVVRQGNVFVVQDIVLLEQVNTCASSRITEETLDRWMSRMKRHGLDTEGYDFYWHSHVRMGTFWSGDDIDTINQLRSQRFTISLVVNKMLEQRCRIDFYDPVRYCIDWLQCRVEPVFGPGLVSGCEQEMRELLEYRPLEAAIGGVKWVR